MMTRQSRTFCLFVCLFPDLGTVLIHARAGGSTVCVSVDNYNVCVSVDNYNVCVSVDNYNVCVSVDNYNVCVSVDNYKPHLQSFLLSVCLRETWKSITVKLKRQGEVGRGGGGGGRRDA